jgi:hypothetical protein
VEIAFKQLIGFVLASTVIIEPNINHLNDTAWSLLD